jgi:hypothetical protein
VRMTVEDRDQWQCLLTDWPELYDLTHSDNQADDKPFKAEPHAAPGTLLEAASPRLLRTMIGEDHARRTAAAEPPQAAS